MRTNISDRDRGWVENGMVESPSSRLMNQVVGHCHDDGDRGANATRRDALTNFHPEDYTMLF